MKEIDANQIAIARYLKDHGSATRKELMPLISWRESKIDAYLSVMAKLKTTGIVNTSYNGVVSYSLTPYGRDNLPISPQAYEDYV